MKTINKFKFSDDTFEGYHDVAQTLSDEYALFTEDLGTFSTIDPEELVRVLKTEVQARALNRMLTTEYGRGFLMGFLLVRNFSEGMDSDSDSKA